MAMLQTLAIDPTLPIHSLWQFSSLHFFNPSGIDVAETVRFRVTLAIPHLSRLSGSDHHLVSIKEVPPTIPFIATLMFPPLSHFSESGPVLPSGVKVCRTLAFDLTLEVEPTRSIEPSRAFDLMSVGFHEFAGSRVLIHSFPARALVASVSFQETRQFAETDAFLPSARGPTPRPTITSSPVPTESEYIPRDGLTESWVASFSQTFLEVSEESVILSFSEVEEERIVTVTFLVDHRVTVSHSIVIEQTRVAISWVVVVISHLPIYVTVNRRVVFQRAMTPDAQIDTKISNAVLIGSTSGGACAIALLGIAVVTVIRVRVKPDPGVPGEPEPTVDRTFVDDHDELGRWDAHSPLEEEFGVRDQVRDLDLVSEDDTMYI
jgi:hypothetical protein